MTNNTDPVRESFERWLKKARGTSTCRWEGTGEYTHFQSQRDWQTWQAALASAPPEDRFEQFVQAEIARSPNALRELGCYLADVLDEDRFPRANRLLLQLATEYAPPSTPVGVEGLMQLAREWCLSWGEWAHDADPGCAKENAAEAALRAALTQALSQQPAAPSGGAGVVSDADIKWDMRHIESHLKDVDAAVPVLLQGVRKVIQRSVAQQAAANMRDRLLAALERAADAETALARMRDQQPAACPKCGGTGEADSGGIMPWGAPAMIPCDCQQPAAPSGVAYLDIGAGGYMDLGSELSDEELAKLPYGRHVLGIIGTHGVDGYVLAQQPAAVGEECAHCVDGIVPMTFDRPCAHCHGTGIAAQSGGSDHE